jgi:heme/copper-type cytochrome/quinol oxidase subunit 2
LGLLIVRKA